MSDHTLAGRVLRAALALLLLVPLFAYVAPAPAAAATPYSIYTFYFANGKVLSGDSRDPSTHGNFEVPVFDTGRTIHVSCSAVFDDGWSSNPPAFPTESVDGAGWEVLSYHIVRDGGKKTCGETFTPGTITVLKSADPATESFGFELSGLIAPPPEGGAAIAIGPFPSVPVLGDSVDSYTWDRLNGGDYTLAELMTQGQAAAGWVFDSVSCDNGASSQTPQVSFELAGGEHVTCTFYNSMQTPPVPGVHIEKATNGQDADSPTGPSVLVGDSVTWTYVVTNTGDVPLSNVSVTDSDAGVTPVYVSGDTNSNNLLDLAETWTFSASGTASLGQYSNIGSVTGTPPEGRQDVSDSDPSHYYGTALPVPSIDIEKATNSQDADTPTGPSIQVGDSVNWTYLVTNTGDVALSNVTVTDDQGVTVTCPKDTLAVDESMTCTASGTASLGQYSNIGSVEGFPPESEVPVTDTDPSHYYGTALPVPSIDIEKATNGQDADTPTGPSIQVGDSVNWTYLVTNTGDVALSNVTVTDDQGVTVTCPKDTLAVDESMTCTGSGTAVLGQYANVGSVTGFYPSDEVEVTDSDPSHYLGYTTPPTTPTTSPPALGSIGDFVWDDTVNKNGVQEAGEPGIGNVLVNLYNGDGTFRASTTTDKDGFYKFSGLAAGTYVVEFVKPAGLEFTAANEAGPDPTDSDANLETGRTGLITLGVGQHDMSWDAGLVGSVSPTTVINTTVPETLPFTGPTSTGVGGFAAAMVLLGGLVLLAFRKKDDPIVETGVTSRLDRYQV